MDQHQTTLKSRRCFATLSLNLSYDLCFANRLSKYQAGSPAQLCVNPSRAEYLEKEPKTLSLCRIPAKSNVTAARACVVHLVQCGPVCCLLNTLQSIVSSILCCSSTCTEYSIVHTPRCLLRCPPAHMRRMPKQGPACLCVMCHVNLHALIIIQPILFGSRPNKALFKKIYRL